MVEARSANVYGSGVAVAGREGAATPAVSTRTVVPHTNAAPTERDDVAVSELGQNLPPGQFGPAHSGGRPTGGWSWRRVAMLATTFAIVVGITTSVTAGALLWYGERAVSRVDVPGLVTGGPAVGAVEEVSEVLNVLLVGDDSRDGLTDEQLQALGTDATEGGRTDTIMLLQIDPNRERAALLSFPRDLLVTRCDGSRGRINGAYGKGEETGVGGAACLVETVTTFTGIPINHYVEVNFAGFIDVVDVLGGVTLYVEKPGIRDRYAGLDLAPGCQRLDGAQALGFVRARRIDNDFGRMARQQRFIRELVNEITSAGTLLNVPRLFALVDATGRAVKTDRALSLADMRRIAFSLRNFTEEQLDARVVPAVPRTINGAAMVVAKEEEAEELFRAFREGTLAPDDLGREEPRALVAEDVPALVVLNGAGVNGLAAAAAELLAGQGFEVASTANAESFDYERVHVLHPPGLREEAELVAGAFGDAVLEPGDPDDGFTVVVGSHFDPATVDEPPEADAQESPEPSPQSGAASPEPSPSPTYLGATAHRDRC